MILTILFFLPFHLNAQIPFFRHYTVADGLTHSTVYYVMQDAKGYIWFCTEAGVNRFDGRRFETFTTADGLADNENFKCYEDRKGRIWFLSYNGKLSYFNNGRFINDDRDTTLKYPILQGKFLRDIIEDKSGRIWFSTFIGDVFVYDGRKIAVIKGKYTCSAYPILFNEGDNVFTIVGDDRGGILYNITTGKPIKLKCKDNVARACSLTLESAGKRYIVSNIGIEHISGDSLITDISNRQVGAAIVSFKIIGKTLWAGRYRGGILQKHNFTVNSNLDSFDTVFPKSTISCIIPDNEGGIWASTMSEGVYYLPGSWSYINNIPAESITSIKHSRNSDLWVTGDYYGQLTIYDKNRQVKKFINPTLPETRIKALAWLEGDRIVAGMDYTPYIYDFKTNRTSFLFKNYSGTSDIYQDTPVSWICERNKIHTIDRVGTTKGLYNTPALNAASDKLVSIVGNEKGETFFTSIRDLYKISNGSNSVIKIAGSEIFNSNLKDLEYENGRLWVATHGNGIFIFNDNKLLHHIYSGNSEITSDICQKLIFDKGQKMWLATNKGISVFDVGNFKYLFRLTSNDVLINNDVKDIDIYNNEAYVATPSGISIIDIGKFVSNTSAPSVYIKKLVAGTTVYKDGVIPGIKYFKGDISLSYSAITFQANQSVRYRYQLKDKDYSWYETTNDQVTFHNLPPGNYTFLVQAKKYNSNWSNAASYTFTIAPLWFQYTFFKVSCFLMAVVFICILYALQIKAIKKREQEKTVYNKRIASLEGNALANQMNPHFIFNSLNTVQHFIVTKNEQQGIRYLTYFSNLIRQILEHSKHQYLDLEEEIAFLKRYLELEQIRFNNKFTFSFHIGDDVSNDIKIPPMMIQPLLENAVKHAFISDDKHIDISFQLIGAILTVVVEDNGIGINAAKEHAIKTDVLHESTALKVIENRLILLENTNGQKGSMTITDKSDNCPKETGTCVTINIPVKNKEWE